MNKKALGALCAAALAVGTVLAGCGSGSTANVELSSAATAITQTIKKSLSQDNISELKNAYDIDSGDVKQFAARHNDSGVRFALIEAISDDAANRIEGKLNDYAGQNGGKVVRFGGYIALFAGDGAEKMEAAFSKLFQ